MKTQRIRISQVAMILESKILMFYCVLAMLIVRSHKSPNLNITHKALAHYCNISESTVCKYMKTLKRYGLVQITKYVYTDENGKIVSQSGYHLFTKPQTNSETINLAAKYVYSSEDLYSYDAPDENFILVDTDYLDNKSLTLIEKALCFNTYHRSNKINGRAYAKRADIMSWLGIGQVAYDKARKHLNSLGYITRKRDTSKRGVVYFYKVINLTEKAFKEERLSKAIKEHKNRIEAITTSFRSWSSKITNNNTHKYILDTLKILSLDNTNLNTLSKNISLKRLKKLAYAMSKNGIRNKNYILTSLGLA